MSRQLAYQKGSLLHVYVTSYYANYELKKFQFATTNWCLVLIDYQFRCYKIMVQNSTDFYVFLKIPKRTTEMQFQPWTIRLNTVLQPSCFWGHLLA